MPITFYICENETIYGTHYHKLPETGRRSAGKRCFLVLPFRAYRCFEVWPGVRRCSEDIGPAGVVIVIIREDLIKDEWLPNTPTILRYKTSADADSMSNTLRARHLHLRKGLQVVEVPWRA